MSLLAIAKELAIAAFVGLAVGAASTWVIQEWRIDAIKADFVLDKAKAVDQEVKRGNQISNDYAEVVRWLNDQKQSHTVTVVKELEKAVYRDTACVLPESGRLLVNDAIREANAARLGRSVLPKGSGTAEPNDAGRSTAVVDVGHGGLRGMLRWKSGVDQVGD